METGKKKMTNSLGYKAALGTPTGRMLTSALPFMALALPTQAFAQNAVNTASVTAPSGAVESDTSNNSATDSDTILADLVATNDDFTGSPILSTGGNTTTVFVNDTLNGSSFADSAVIVSITDDDGMTGVSIASDGTITVPAGTAPGTYNVEYQICEAANPTNCRTAIAEILVGGVADLQTVKVLASGNAEPGVGETVTFEITVTNNGGDTATNITLTDSLPAGLTATGNNGDVTAGSYASGTGVWTIPSLADGASATLTIEGTVDAGQEGNTITNVTTAATSDETDPTTTGDDLDESVDVINTIVADNDDFSGTPVLSTGGNTASVFSDDTLNGAAFANGDVVPTITNDGGLTGVSINADGTLTVPAGATPGTYTVTYQICEAADTDNCDTAEAIVSVGGVADLQTVKVLTSGNAEPAVGETVTFEITVTNNGGDTATNITLTDSLPAGLTATGNNGDVTAGSYASGTGVWTIPSLADGASATLTIEGTVDAGQEGNTIQNVTTAATSDETDPTTTGDDLDESVDVINTIVADNDDFSGTPVLSTGGNTASVFSDDTLNGAAFANGDVVPTITNDGGLTGVSINADGTLTVPAGATPGTYTVTYQICEAADTDNCDTAEAIVSVGGVADLQTVKVLTSGNAEPAVGETVTFEITVTNNGGDTATNITLTDSLPAGLTATGNNGDVTAGSYASGTGVWTIPSLADGASATLTIEGTVDAGQEGNTITNVTTAATSDETDPTTTGDDLEEAVDVINSIVANDNDFSGTAIPSTGGDTATVFSNDTLNGSAFANGDVVPTVTNDGGLTGVSINPDGTLTVPNGSTPGDYTVTYQICEAADTDNCDTATVEITIAPVVDLSITKSNGVNEVTSGDSITYTLVVSNAGPDAAVGAVVADNPVSGLSCPVAGTVTITGDGVPAGSFTIGDLQAGITLGTLNAGESATITYTCTVN